MISLCTATLFAFCLVFSGCGVLPQTEETARISTPKTVITYPREIPLPWKDAMNKAAVFSQDGGNPIIYPNGALLTFGDTYLGSRGNEGIFFAGGLSNSLLHLAKIGESCQWQYLTDAKNQSREFIPMQSPECWDKNRIWPGSGVFTNGRFYVYYELTKTTDGGVKFQGDRHWGLMRSNGSWQTWERVKLSRSFPFTAIPGAVISDGKGMLYLYFIEKRGDNGIVRVTQVPEKEIENPASYKTLESALVQDAGGQVSVAWNAYLNAYVMCHPGSISGNPRDVYIHTAQSPVGPFSAPQRAYGLYPCAPEKKADERIVGAFLQPSLFRENGRIMALTYSLTEANAVPHLVEFEAKRP